MKQIIEHALIVLERTDDWITPDELTAEVRAVFPKADMRPVFEKLRKLAHIGYFSKEGYRYYEPNELTNKIQECLARGDAW